MADLRTARRTAEQLAATLWAAPCSGPPASWAWPRPSGPRRPRPLPRPPRGPVRSSGPPRPRPPPWSAAPARKPPRPTPATRPLRDGDAGSVHQDLWSPVLLWRAGGYWWDGQTWYRPPQLWDRASEDYV